MKLITQTLWQGREDVTLTAYLLDNCFDMDPKRKRPAILICPGGGYQYCSDREAEPVAMKFAGMGYHTMVLRYSVADETSSTMDFELHPDTAGWVTLAHQWLGRHMPLTVLHGEGDIPTRGHLPAEGGIPVKMDLSQFQ